MDGTHDVVDTTSAALMGRVLTKRSVSDHEFYTTHGECRRSNVIGQLVQDASQFLFPCTIEYSLICAAMLYMLWKRIERPTENRNRSSANSESNHPQAMVQIHSKHQYQVRILGYFVDDHL